MHRCNRSTNPYRAPRGDFGDSDEHLPREEPRFRRVCLDGQAADRRTAIAAIYALFICTAALDVTSAVWWIFGMEWEPETGTFMVFSLFGFLLSFLVAVCAAILTGWLSRRLSFTARCYGFATPTLPLVAAAIAILCRAAR